MHLVWHRTELRTHDHPALAAAARSGEPVVPLVIIDPIIFGRPTTTARRQAWFLENVRALRDSYRSLGADLVVREGVPHEVLAKFSQDHGITHAHYIRNHTPYAAERDAAAEAALVGRGVEVHAYPGQYTQPPGEVRTGAGGRYGVFGPYLRRWLALPRPELAATPERLPAVPRRIPRGTMDFPTDGGRLRFQIHLDKQLRSRSDGVASSSSSGSMSCAGKGRRSDRSHASFRCRGTRYAATSATSHFPT